MQRYRDAPPAVDGHVRSCLFRLPAGLADGFGPEDEPYASSKTAMRFTPSTGSPAFPLGSSARSKSIAYKAGKVKHRGQEEAGKRPCQRLSWRGPLPCGAGEAGWRPPLGLYTHQVKKAKEALCISMRGLEEPLPRPTGEAG